MKIFASKCKIMSYHNLQRYFNFIESYKDYSKIKNKTESHHIYPKSIFPEYDQTEYLVNLPLRAHYIAHYMLALSIGSKMWSAFQLMGRIKKHKSWQYKKFKEQALIYNRDPEKCLKISKSVKALWDDPVYRKMQSENKKGKVVSEYTRQKISNSLTGLKKPEGFGVGRVLNLESKIKISKSKIGIKNPSVKPITIYKDDDTPFVTVLVKFNEVCRELGIPTSLYHTLKSKERLYCHKMRRCDITLMINKGNYKYKGWYAKYAKLNS